MLHDHQTSVRPKTQHEIDNIFYSVTLFVLVLLVTMKEADAEMIGGIISLWIPPSIVVYRSRE